MPPRDNSGVPGERTGRLAAPPGAVERRCAVAYGYTGKILVADLTSGPVAVDEHDDAWYRKYMSGAAMARDYISRGVPPQGDPLGPENILVFARGPLAGTAISGQSRMSVACKSPLSGLIGDVQVGGFLPAELKMAGFAAVVVNSTGL